MKNILVILCISLVLFCACTNDQKQSGYAIGKFSGHDNLEMTDSFCTIPYNGLKNLSITKDSVFIIEKSDQIFEIKLININYEVVEDFVNFFHDTKGKFKTIHMDKADYSGDGQPDLYTEKFIIGEDNIKIERTVSNQSKDVLWKDSILVNDEPLFFFCNDSIGTLTYPYSMFFKAWLVSYYSTDHNGLKIRNVDSLVPKGLHRDRLKRLNYSDQDIQLKMQEFENYRNSYNGYLVVSLGYINNDLYFYFPDSNRFILYYAP